MKIIRNSAQPEATRRDQRSDAHLPAELTVALDRRKQLRKVIARSEYLARKAALDLLEERVRAEAQALHDELEANLVRVRGNELEAGGTSSDQDKGRRP